MKTIKVGKDEVKIYSDPEELSVENYKLYTKYLAIAADIGDDFNAVNTKLNDILLVAGDAKKVITEVNNLRQTMYNIYNIDISVDSKLLAIMVHSINGDVCKDKTEDGLELIVKKLNTISASEVKKKTMKSTD